MKNQVVCQAVVGLLMLGLTACRKENDTGVVFQLKNSTTARITKAQIFSSVPASSQLLLDGNDIQQGATYEQSIKVNSLPKSDGGYELRITQPGQSRAFRFGYFTNGTDLIKTYSLDIAKDTVMVKSVLRDL